MPGGGGNVARPHRPQATTRERAQHRQASVSLPLRIVLEIAACSDPVTLVRCAATCWDVRRRIAEDAAFRRRLRLRHSDRFVLPLLRGHLVVKPDYSSREEKRELYLVDTSGATKVRKVTAGISSAPLASRDGLLLLRDGKELRVCEPATGRSQIIPSMPTFPPSSGTRRLHYALLVGGAAGETGPPGFQVLVAALDLSSFRRHLEIQTFSSEHGTWAPFTEIRIPNLYGRHLVRDLGRHVVIGGAVHWLCLTDAGSYVIKLHVRSAQVTVTELPESFPGAKRWQTGFLLATTTTSGGGSPIVLVADRGVIWAWSQSKQTTKWKQQPQPVTNAEKLVQFAVERGGTRQPVMYGQEEIVLHWFAERSGMVLIQIRYYGFFWLDLQTMEVVRWFSDPELRYATVNYPYEIGLSSWAPTFNRLPFVPQ